MYIIYDSLSAWFIDQLYQEFLDLNEPRSNNWDLLHLIQKIYRTNSEASICRVDSIQDGQYYIYAEKRMIIFPRRCIWALSMSQSNWIVWGHDLLHQWLTHHQFFFFFSNLYAMCPSWIWGSGFQSKRNIHVFLTAANSLLRLALHDNSIVRKCHQISYYSGSINGSIIICNTFLSSLHHHIDSLIRRA